MEETPCGIAEYLGLYRTRRALLLKRRGGLVKDHPASVATTWSLSFAAVEQTNPAAADLLRVCAFLHPDVIPEELLRQGILESVAADGRRTRTIRLSKRGWEAVDQRQLKLPAKVVDVDQAVHFGRNTRRRIERRLQRQVGLKRYQDARNVLLTCLKSFGGISRVRTRRIRAPR